MFRCGRGYTCSQCFTHCPASIRPTRKRHSSLSISESQQFRSVSSTYIMVGRKPMPCGANLSIIDVRMVDIHLRTAGLFGLMVPRRVCQFIHKPNLDAAISTIDCYINHSSFIANSFSGYITDVSFLYSEKLCTVVLLNCSCQRFLYCNLHNDLHPPAVRRSPQGDCLPEFLSFFCAGSRAISRQLSSPFRLSQVWVTYIVPLTLVQTSAKQWTKGPGGSPRSAGVPVLRSTKRGMPGKPTASTAARLASAIEKRRGSLRRCEHWAFQRLLMLLFYLFTTFDLIVFPYGKGCHMAFALSTLALDSEDLPPLLLLQATDGIKVLRSRTP